MIHLGAPNIDDGEIEAVMDALSAGTLSSGEIVSVFEGEFAAFAGRDHAAAVCSGSVALELAFEVSDLEPGDGIVISPFNCGAVLYSALRAGLQPVFCDINLDTYNPDPATVERAIERSDGGVRGLLVAHLYGQPADMAPFEAMADEHDLVLVEDFAQAPGAEYRGHPAGSFGDVGICSFGATKNLTTAEGGIVVTDEASIAERVRTLRTNTDSTAETPHRSVRMNDLEAAIGRQQLQKYDDMVERKREVAAVYHDRLPSELELPSVASDRTHVYHGFPVRADDPDSIANGLAERGIETARVYDTPLHEYACAPATEHRFPGAERAAKEVLLLPIHSRLSPAEAETVADAVAEFYETDR